MDKKDIHKLSDSTEMKKENHKNAGNEYSSVKELVSFLEHYQVPAIDNSSIKEKTFEKIKKAKMKHRRYLLISLLSAAASVLLLLTFYWNYPTYDKSKVASTAKNVVQIVASTVDVNKYKDVTLLLSGRQLVLSGKDKIEYDRVGNIRVNGELVDNKKQNEKNQLVVPAGKRASLVLADGTKIEVNSKSYIVYPRVFDGNKRVVYAEGEAFLDVAHNKHKPFVVKSADFNLQVLGTKFNIRTYRQLKETQIVLVKGAVKVTDNNRKTTVMKPSQLLCLERGNISRQESVDVSDYISWTQGWLELNGKSLDDLARTLSVYYGSTLVCDYSVADKKVYGKLELKDNLNEVLHCIQQIVPIGLHKDGSVIRINNLKSNSKIQ